MDVQIERRAEALDESDGTALLGPGIPLLSRAPAKLGEQGSDEDAEDLAGELRVVGTAVSEWIGQRQHPLANRHLWQDSIDQVRGGIRHAAPAARGTEATALAREGHQAVVAALVAVQSQEAVGQDAAAKEGAKLLRDEAGRGLIPVARPREEAFQLLADDVVKEGLLRLMPRVLGHEVPDRDRSGEVRRLPR